MRKPMRKCTIEEICTSKLMDMPCNRWISNEECVDYIVELIQLGLLSLNEMKLMLFYQDFCKVRKAYNNAQKR